MAAKISILDERRLSTIALNSFHESPIANERFPPSPYYRFLRNLISVVEPDLSVELGLCGGGGSYHMCLGNPNGLVVGVDHQIEYPDNLKWLNQSLNNFEFIQCDSIIALAEIYRRYGEINFIFVDTDHTYERTMIEYQKCLEVVSSEAIICFDDLNRTGMTKFWNELDRRKYRFDYLHHSTEGDGGFGIAIIE